MQDENGEIKIKEERDMTGITLSGDNQNIETAAYLQSFAEFINSENPQALLRSLFCDIPERLFLSLNPEEQLDFVHKLDRCVTTIKIYSQSAEVNRRNIVETLDLEEQVKLRKQDREYKAKPRNLDSTKLNQETKQQKFVNMMRDLKDKDGKRLYSEEDIAKMIHGESK